MKSASVPADMLIRLWVTNLRPDRVAEYDTFAQSRSLAMFRALDGCEGVIFLRSECRGYVLSLWRDLASIDALATSPIYAATVRDIVAAGFLEEPQTVDMVGMTGAFLSGEALRFLDAAVVRHTVRDNVLVHSRDCK